MLTRFRLRRNVLALVTVILVSVLSVLFLRQPVQAQDSYSGLLGQIIVVPYDGEWCPTGYAKTDGTLLDPGDANNGNLFALLHNKYGGDGRTTFALPNLEGPGGTTSCINMTGIYPQR